VSLSVAIDPWVPVLAVPAERAKLSAERVELWQPVGTGVFHRAGWIHKATINPTGNSS